MIERAGDAPTDEAPPTEQPPEGGDDVPVHAPVDEDPPPPPPEQRKALQDLEAVLLRINGLSTLVKDVRELRALLYERRAARVAVLGRRGAGKSSLANALLGAEVLTIGAVEDTTQEAGWVTLGYRGRAVRWLDTPGLRAGAAENRREVVRRAVAAEAPDAILVAVRATQVDSGVDEDIAQVRWILDRVKAQGGEAPPVIAVVTRVDEVAPVTAKQAPFPAAKRASIDKACGVLRGHLEKAGINPTAVVPVAAYMRFFKDHTLAVDWRWNLDTLAAAMFDALPHAAQAESARAFDSGRTLRRKVALRLVHAATSLAFFIGTTPVPVADLALLAPLQSVMITGVMYVAGRRVDGRGLSEWLTALGVNVGAGFALREAARGLAKFVPGLGTALSAAIAATGTWALGMSAVRYFVEHGTADEARQAYETARRAGAPKEATDRATPRSDEAKSETGSHAEATTAKDSDSSDGATEQPRAGAGD